MAIQLSESLLRACSVRNEKVEGISTGLLSMLVDLEPVKKDPKKDSKKNPDVISLQEKELKKDPEWIVKNMSFDEQQKALEDARQSIALLKEDLPKDKSGNDIVDSLMILIKTCKAQNKELSTETLYRLNVLKYGTVSPTVSHTQAVLVATHFGMDFKIITDRILELTQMGSFSKKK